MAPTAAYVECERLLRALHALYLEGKDQSPDGDEIRSAMEPLWREMTEPEREAIDTLSGALYDESGR